MKVLCHKQQLLFANHGKWIAPVGEQGSPDYVPGHYEGGGGDNVAVSPMPGIQDVPDWIRDTNTFKVAAKAGLIFEVGIVNPENGPDEPDAKPETTQAAKTEPATGLSGNTGGNASGGVKRAGK